MVPARLSAPWLAIALVALLGAQPPRAGVVQSNGQLRVLYAVPGVLVAAVLVDGAPVAGPLAFGADTGYLFLSAGPHTIGLVAVDAAAGAALPTADLDLGAGQAKTVLVGGTPPVALVLTNLGVAPLGGPALVRLAHLAAGVPRLELASAGGPVLVRDVAYGDASPYADVPPGAMTLVLRPAGTDTVMADIPGAVLVSDRSYTFVAVGVPGERPSVAILALVDS